MAPRYVFHTRWFTRDARLEEVADVLLDTARLAEWWPAVYLEVRVVEPGGAHGVGSTLDLFTKGWLPYTLRWQLHVESVDYSNGSTISARGDLTGHGVWQHRSVGGGVETTYDWEVAADKPLLRYGSLVFRPLFAANHRWAMATGERSLQLEVARRRGETVGPPPPPTFRPRRIQRP
jgi:hypothetical protein